MLSMTSPELAFVLGRLVLGLFTRPALVAAMLVTTSLVFGSSLLEQWDTMGSQVLYGLFIFALLLHCQHNRLGLERRAASA